MTATKPYDLSKARPDKNDLLSHRLVRELTPESIFNHYFDDFSDEEYKMVKKIFMEYGGNVGWETIPIISQLHPMIRHVEQELTKTKKAKDKAATPLTRYVFFVYYLLIFLAHPLHKALDKERKELPTCKEVQYISSKQQYVSSLLKNRLGEVKIRRWNGLSNSWMSFKLDLTIVLESLGLSCLIELPEDGNRTLGEINLDRRAHLEQDIWFFTALKDAIGHHNEVKVVRMDLVYLTMQSGSPYRGSDLFEWCRAAMDCESATKDRDTFYTLQSKKTLLGIDGKVHPDAQDFIMAKTRIAWQHLVGNDEKKLTDKERDVSQVKAVRSLCLSSQAQHIGNTVKTFKETYNMQWEYLDQDGFKTHFYPGHKTGGKSKKSGASTDESGMRRVGSNRTDWPLGEHTDGEPAANTGGIMEKQAKSPGKAQKRRQRQKAKGKEGSEDSHSKPAWLAEDAWKNLSQDQKALVIEGKLSEVASSLASGKEAAISTTAANSPKKVTFSKDANTEAGNPPLAGKPEAGQKDRSKKRKCSKTTKNDNGPDKVKKGE